LLKQMQMTYDEQCPPKADRGEKLVNAAWGWRIQGAAIGLGYGITDAT
jgi:hypothetical protein